MRITREHGRILSVETKFRGDALAEDALASATTLVVADAEAFNETGGWLTINDQVIEYTEVDDDASTITLAEGLTAAADQGDAVHLYSEFYQGAVDYQELLVELDGEYDNPETVVAELADGLEPLPEGDRGKGGESCTLLRVSDDEWEVVNVGGRPKRSAGQQYEADDVYVLTAADIAAGTATQPLTHRPVRESVDARWGVLPQEPAEYTVNYDAQTITWPLGGFEVAGDRLWVHYEYLVAGATLEAGDDPVGVLLVTRDAAQTSVTTTKAALEAGGFTVTVAATDSGTGIDQGRTVLDALDLTNVDVIVSCYPAAYNAGYPWVEWLREKWDAGYPIMVGGREYGTVEGAAEHASEHLGFASTVAVQNNADTEAVTARSMRIDAAHAATTGYVVGATHQVMVASNYFVFAWGGTLAGTRLGYYGAGSGFEGPYMCAVNPGDAMKAGALAPATAPARAAWCGWLYGGESDYTDAGKTILAQTVNWLAGR